MISRRSFLGQTAGFTFLLAGGRRVWALPSAAETITVFKSRTCGCCAEWVDYLKAEGFATVVHDEEEMDMVKDNLGVPAKVRSCHTGQAGKYLVEGHVPAEDIRRMLKEQPPIAGPNRVFETSISFRSPRPRAYAIAARISSSPYPRP